MGNCLQGAETDDVNLLHNDNDTAGIGSRSSTSLSRENSSSRSRNQNNETSISGAGHSHRSSRRSSGRRSSNNGSSEYRQRRSSDSGIRIRSGIAPPPSYEVATMQRSTAIGSSASLGTLPVYHPSAGVSRQASELTEEEQIKIAQRIGLIQHLPVDVYVEGKKTDTECIICMADFVEGDRVRFLPCMHPYHVDCIDEWLMRQFACPSCLEPVDSALLTSYDQQQLTAFTESGSGSDDGAGGTSCSLPRQLEQLTAVTSPPSSVPISVNSKKN